MILAGVAAFSAAQTGNEKAFRQEGIASWYGSEFDGKPTASGEIFNSGLFTAAHPSLPFGTILTVTNKQNKRKVTVRVNDRGPFVSSRIVDVSRAAAEVLDMINTGTAPVILENEAYITQFHSDQDEEPVSAEELTSIYHPSEVIPEITEENPVSAEEMTTAPQLSEPISEIPDEAPVLVSEVTTEAPPSEPVSETPVEAPVFVSEVTTEAQPSEPVPEIPVEAPVLVSEVTTETQPSEPVPITPTKAPAPVNVAPAPTPAPVPVPAPASVPVTPVKAVIPAPVNVAPAVIIGNMPPAGSTKLYRLQVGAYKIPRNATDAFEKLKKAGLSPRYEQYGEFYRVVLAGIKASEIRSITQILGNAGFREVLIREETGL